MSRTVVVTAVTVFEVEFGLMRMPASQRRTVMEESWNRMVTTLHPVGVLKLDYAAAVIAAELDAARQARGINLDFRDAFIAGIVLANDARIATRNVRHFADLGDRVIDPWAMSPHSDASA